MHAQAAILTATNEASIVLTGVTADAVLTPGTTEVTVKQCYSNQESMPVEAVYTFPLPLDAVLLDIHVQVGSRILTGKILPREEAENSYEDAIVDGDKAIMLQQLQAGLYTMNLGNLSPGEDCVISYRFTSLNRWSGKTLRFCLPSTIAPRFGEPTETGLAPQQIPEYAMDGSPGLNITVQLMETLAGAHIASPSHSITVEKDATVAKVSLNTETVSMDRDFILTIDADTGVSSSASIAPDIDRWLVHTSFCPHIEVVAAQSPSAVKLVLDCSGSMSGDSIAQGREALLRIVDSMLPGDFFSLLRFGSSYEFLFGSEVMQPATDANKAMAKACIQILDADMGGTEIAAALQAALKISSPIDAPADVLLITDGNVWDYDASVAAASRFGQRIFTVGVGSAVTESYVRNLAEETGGACELVSPNEDMAGKIHRHFLRINSPRCEDMEISWDSEPVRGFPAKSRAIYDGDTVHLFHWFNEAPSRNVAVRLNLPDGRVIGDSIAIRLAEVRGAESESPHDLARIAAATMIRGGVEANVGTKLALDYQLMSQWTNYLIIDEMEIKDAALQLPELRKIASQIPAGWGGIGTVQAMRCLAPESDNFESLSFDMRDKQESRVFRERLASFLIDDDNDPQDQLLEKVKELIPSFRENAFIPPSLSDLALEEGMESALQNLVDDGIEQPLVVSIFLYFFALGLGENQLERQELRTLRKLYRTACARAGEDSAAIGQRVVAAAGSESSWRNVVSTGSAKALRESIGSFK